MFHDDILTRRQLLRGTAGVVASLPWMSATAQTADNQAPIAIGARRELFVDNHLIERLEGMAEKQERLWSPGPVTAALLREAASTLKGDTDA